MTATRPRMVVLIDRNVPEDVAALFVERGHRVAYSRTLRGPGAPDEVIATRADDLAAVVVTWDKDFSRLIARAAIGERQRFRFAGRISFINCRYVIGRRRVERYVEVIELEWARAQERRDKRLIVTIRPHQCVFEG